MRDMCKLYAGVMFGMAILTSAIIPEPGSGVTNLLAGAAFFASAAGWFK